MARFVPDCVIFVVSQPYLSRKRERLMVEGLCAQGGVPARCIRLEGTGPSLSGELDAATASGARRILVQPLGLPFSESLSAWLPGALAHWLASTGSAVQLRLGEDVMLSPELLSAIAERAVDEADEAAAMETVRPSLGPRGWDHAGEAREHVFLCTGPRCHFRDAPRLRTVLQEELRRARLLERCQVTESSCLGPCNLGPLVAHYPDGRWYRIETREDARAFVETALLDGVPPARLLVHALSADAGEAAV